MYITSEEKEKLKPWLDDDWREKIRLETGFHIRTVDNVMHKGNKNESVVRAIRLMAKVNREVYDFQPILPGVPDNSVEGKIGQILSEVQALDSEVTKAINTFAQVMKMVSDRESELQRSSLILGGHMLSPE